MSRLNKGTETEMEGIGKGTKSRRTERRTDRQTERQTDSKTDRQKDRWTEIQTD